MQPVLKLGTKLVFSAAVLLSTADVQGKRYAMPNTTIMMHHPSGSARGQASDIHNEARELMRVRNYVNGVLSNITNKDITEVTSIHASCLHACCTAAPRFHAALLHEQLVNPDEACPSASAALPAQANSCADFLWCAAQIQYDFNRNKYFDAKGALEYGLIDRVLDPPRVQQLSNMVAEAKH